MNCVCREGNVNADGWRSCGEIYTTGAFTRAPFGLKKHREKIQAAGSLVWKTRDTADMSTTFFTDGISFLLETWMIVKIYIPLTVLNRTIIIVIFITN